METLMQFVTALAWVIGILSSIFTVLRIWSYVLYTDLKQINDLLEHGGTRKFYIRNYGLVAIVCWCWIWAQYV